VINHYPIWLPTLRELLTGSLVWGLLEFLLWTGVLVCSERRSRVYVNGLNRVWRLLARIGNRRVLTLVGIFVVVFAGRLVVVPIYPPPNPKIADEFSELLASDTFASGRLTNPAHPMAFYFETLFVNQKPTYHSMYPPAPGFFMAAAQVLTGQPWYGMLFSVAAAAAAVGWMLQGWMSPRWALWGAIVFMLLIERAHLTENYGGQGIVILAGALVLGAIPRIIKHHSRSASVWLGIGIALLATTRPYEGAFLVLGLGFGGLCWASKSGMSGSAILRKVVCPVSIILVPVFLMMGYMNWRTTGSPLLAPYELNLIEQHITRPLLWQKIAPIPQYHHASMALFYQQWESNWFEQIRRFPRGLFLLVADKMGVIYQLIVWPFAGVLVIGVVRLLKSDTFRFLPLAFFFYLVGLGLEAYPLLSRYAQPAWALIMLLVLYGLRQIGAWKRRGHIGLQISRTAILLLPIFLLLANIGVSFMSRRPRYAPWYDARYELSQYLRLLPGKQLVIVRYSPSHVPSEEWVYNRADIDAAKVIWARDVGDRGNSDLLKYFKGRSVWLLQPDGPVLELTSYDGCARPLVSEIGSLHVTLCQYGENERFASQSDTRLQPQTRLSR